MRWSLRRRSEQPALAAPGEPGAHLPAVRIEQALVSLAVQTQQIDSRLAVMETRIAACEATAAELPSSLEVPSHDDLLDVRMHSAKVAAEVSRLTINLYARLDDLAVQHRAALAELERRRAEVAPVMDLRDTPGDWAASA